MTRYSETSVQKSGSSPRPHLRIRWIVWALLTVATMLNFADRAVFGIVAPYLIDTFDLSPSTYGIASSAFNWGYTPAQLLAGVAVLYLGPRRTMLGATLSWGLLIALTPIAPTFGVLLLIRILFGIAEGVNFPCAGAFIAAWFPATERNLAAALVGVGQAASGAVFAPLSSQLAEAAGWKVPFFVLGALSLAWAILAFPILFDRPRNCRFVTHEESLQIAENSTNIEEEQQRYRATWSQIFGSRTVWGGAVGLFAAAYMIYIALTFFPLYLSKVHGGSEESLSGDLLWPWLAFGVGALLGGRVSDWIYVRTHKLRIARGLLGGGTIVLVGLTNLLISRIGTQEGIAIFLLSIMMFLVGWANTNFGVTAVDSCPLDPARTTGIVFGIASSAGLLAPLITGFLVDESGSFESAFTLASAVCLVAGALAFAMIGKDIIEPAVSKPSSNSL